MLFHDTFIRNISRKAFTVLILSSLFLQTIAPISAFADETEAVESAPITEVETNSVSTGAEASDVITTPSSALPSPQVETSQVTTVAEDTRTSSASTDTIEIIASTTTKVIDSSLSTSTVAESMATTTISSTDFVVATTTDTNSVASTSDEVGAHLFAPKQEVIPEVQIAPVRQVENAATSVGTSSVATSSFSRVIVVTDGLNQKLEEIVAPEGTKYAVVKAWGAAGGSFGNDNYSYGSQFVGGACGGRSGRSCVSITPASIYAVQGLPSNNTIGGHGAFVSGVIQINPGEKLSVNPGLGGYSGYREDDDNDVPGLAGASSTVSFKGEQIIVAGAGAPLGNGAVSLDGSTRVYLNTTNETAQIEPLLTGLRNEFSNGGSPATKSSSSYLADTQKWYTNLSSATAKAGVPFWGLEGGDGVSRGVWKFREVLGKYVVGGITGGSSYVAPSVIKPLFYSGDPAENALDEGVWSKYLSTSGVVPAKAVCCSTRSGGGAVVVEFWTSMPITPGTPVDPAQPSVTLNLTLGGVSINASSTVPAQSNPTFTWSFSNVPSNTTCSITKTSVGGTSFADINTISPVSGINSALTGPLTEGVYSYKFSCGTGVESFVSFTVLPDVTTSQAVFTTKLTATPSTIGTGATSTLVWLTSNAVSCTASNGGSGWSGSKPLSGSFVVGPITLNTTYTLSCTGANGLATTSDATIIFSNINGGGGSTTTPSFSTVLTASPNPVTSTGSSTIVWSSVNTTSCIASLGSTGWAGAKPVSGTFVVSGISAATTYTIDCSGPNGSTTSTFILGFTPGTVVTPPIDTPSTGGGGGGGGRCIGFGCPETTVVTTATTTDIMVYFDLPTTTPTTNKVCPAQDFITQYLKKTIENNPNEVRKLKYFLNRYENTSLTVDGTFDDATEQAVKDFQLKYSDEILKPWGITTPTGIVYITTKAQINMIFCKDNPTFRGDDDLKDIMIDSALNNNVVNPDDFKDDIGFNTATSTASSSVPLRDSNNLASAFFGLENLLKDINWYPLLVLLLLILGSGLIIQGGLIKDKNKEASRKALSRGALVFTVGVMLNVLNSVSFIYAPLWLLATLGIGLGWVLSLNIVALICILTILSIFITLISQEKKVVVLPPVNNIL